ncbi:hypothetical protein GTCCBUS3UF5_27660 [Geobacillus thermoleovorans CCB_US3_UF5]|uniref:Uncharacterized protein n=1 Tax=Geobacillus thermoleovorans CCB_US3_UF5 TaxID=1111068 RepID=A0ABN4A4Z4_GEOTH|nr:hypothetical protein GTCCBUS3UF5_27660 [Geobacillus thermoleovorans CCB_US3_UF5]
MARAAKAMIAYSTTCIPPLFTIPYHSLLVALLLNKDEI